MKPFNLEAAKAGETVQTRRGDRARVISFDTKKNCLVMTVLVDEGTADFPNENCFLYDFDGLRRGGCYNTLDDLFMTSAKPCDLANG